MEQEEEEGIAEGVRDDRVCWRVAIREPCLASEEEAAAIAAT